jgi:hypothetical protein
MEPEQQQGTGDYGYDLVHEDVAAGSGRRDRDAGPHDGPAPSREDAGPGGDLSYDQSHDF